MIVLVCSHNGPTMEDEILKETLPDEFPSMTNSSQILTMKMDSIFNLEETKRSSLLREIIESCGFTYVCLWSHFPHHSNCLIFIDGVYKEENQHASTSTGSLAMRSFLDYQKSMFLVDNYSGRVPGFAFMHKLSYVEHTGLELLELASNPAQLQFYHEARIKTAIFMGCKNGEIELGMSNYSSSHVNNEFELKKLFPGDFAQELLLQPLDQAQASSSPPSSMENNINHPPFLFNMLHTSSSDPLQQALIQIRTSQLMPSREHEEAEMTRAILAAISSSSPPPPPPPPRSAGAFKRYRTYIGPVKRVQNQQNLNRRSLLFLKNRSEAPGQQDLMVYTTRPANSQLHHMISERKRREKLNESFQALRSLLPPGSKKDKTSVLSNIKEYVASLKSQVDELNRRNKILEADYTRKKTLAQDSSGSSNERSKIRIKELDEITSDSRIVDMEVNVRGNVILSDLVIRVLEFMNQVENATVTSVEAETQVLETEVTTNQVVLRFKIQGNEWNRSTFQEALTRVLDDLAQ